MRIEFLKEWMKYKIGDTTEDVAPGVADVLFKRRIAKAAPAAQEPRTEPQKPVDDGGKTARVAIKKRS